VRETWTVHAAREATGPDRLSTTSPVTDIRATPSIYEARSASKFKVMEYDL
jgi:hypothetical protein